MVFLLLLWWLAPVVLIGGFWILSALIWEGFGLQNDITYWVYTCILHGNFKWWFLCLWLIISVVIIIGASSKSSTSSPILAGIAALTAVAMVACGITFEVNQDKHQALYYTTSTTFYVKDVSNIPSSVRLLTGDGATQTDRCAVEYRGKHDDSFGCIQQGDMPIEGWMPRVGSHKVAVHALKNTSGDRQGVSLDERTVTSLNGKNGVWSGILDGSDINVPLGGVAEWSGRGNARECRFDGEYALDRAFAGGRSKSLTNLFSERFPLLDYEMTDVWGYCKSHGEGKPQEPIVVIPVTMPVPYTYAHRTVDVAAGIVLVRGDHGKTVLEYKPDVKSGEFPGPVYPESLVVLQRNESFWAGGRENNTRNNFGFEPTNAEVQAGNVSEFLMMEKTTGRLQYLTPLVLRGSGSQLFVAYAVSYADEVHRGQLNELKVYVLNDDDPRRVPLNLLVSSTDQWLTQHAPYARINGGVLQEFVPTNGDSWRAYIENETQVSYIIDIKNSDLENPKLTPMMAQASTGAGVTPAPAPAGIPSTGQPGSSAACGQGQPLDQLSVEQLTQCGKSVYDELQKRLTAGAPPK